MKRLLLVVALFSLLFASNVYACVGEDCKLDSNVQDTNDGNQGYIFTYCGEKGNNSLGTWVDPKDVPELKGEKGDTGERGEQGERGETGATGATGLQGEQGIKGDTGSQGLVGERGDTGEQGISGQDGKQGEVGATGETGDKGTDGKTPIKNIDYFDGINGLNGTNGKDVDPKTVNELNNKIDNNSNRIDKLEESQYIVGGVLRIKNTKKWDVDLFADYSMSRQIIDRSGIRFTYKVGESYQDKEMKRLENRIQVLENK
jgi:hypothetical protein